MTRTYTKRPVWVWQCDVCGHEEHYGRATAELPTMDDMRAAGWFVAEDWGDKCPACVLAGKGGDR